ncbi:MAG: hypothetical protein AAGN82_26440 [Myxococcota bacterium]
MHFHWTRGAALSAALGLAFAACSATEVDFDDGEDDDGSGGSATTTTTNPTATGGNGAGGDVSGTGGGTTGACEQDCSAIATPACLKSVCNEGDLPGVIGTCVVVPDDAGTPCDDELFCTVDDACDGAGTCVGGGPNDCGNTPGACENITCDEATDSCGVENKAVGEACVSTDLCLTGTTCDATGACTGVPNDCFFGPVPNECFNSVCNPSNGMCEPVAGNDGAACVDTNDLCSENNTCSAGVCSGGTPKNCSGLTAGCDLGVCDAQTGQCTTQTVMDGQVCDDLDGCTVNEICTSGTCGGGTPITACSGASTQDGCCPSGCTVANDLDCATCESTFDDGTLQGWTVTSTCSPQIAWQPDTTRSHAGTHSLYYGDAVTQTYACTGGTHSGTARSKMITLQPGTVGTSFEVFIDTEGGTAFDLLELWVLPANQKVWDRNDFSQGQLGDTGGQFINQSVDLTPYAGQTIQLEFRFDTTDSIANSTEGVYIDSVITDGFCP